MPNKRKCCGTVFACLLLALSGSCSRESPRTVVVTINNLRPRCDVTGRIIDAHGGCLQFFHGCFYLYGNAFGTNRTDTFFNCPFSVYSSPDLEHWTFQGDLLKDAPKGVYFRPYVVFNPKTKKYVLWYNWYKTLWHGQAGVAVSDTPVGPFKVVTPKAHLAGTSPGDGSLFVDNDGTGYYIYTDIENDYGLRVERLTPDFLDSSGVVGGYIGFGIEAPLLFRRDDIYYVLAGTLCSDCPRGSEVSVEMSGSPLGPYVFGGNINHFAGTNNIQASADNAVEPDANDTNKFTSEGRYIHARAPVRPFIRAQQTWVARLPTAPEPSFIWMADGWGSATDGMRAHDFQYWSAPLKFNPDGTIQPLRYTPYWTITRVRKSQ